MQVVYCQDGNWYFFENGNDQQLFDQCWWLEKHSLPNHIARKYQFFHQIVKESIDNEYFVLSNFDNYYIEVSSPSYQQQHFIHEALIYGYDLNKNIAYVADNFKNGKYVYTTCSLANLDLAFSKVPPSESAVFLYKKRKATIVFLILTMLSILCIAIKMVYLHCKCPIYSKIGNMV